MTLTEKIVVSLLALTFSLSSFSNEDFDEHLIEITVEDDSSCALLKFVKTPDLFHERWDTLPQPNFWREIMYLSPDSCILNVAKTRQVLEYKSISDWERQTDDEKEAYRNKLRKEFGLDPEERIYMTTGKSDFFQFEKVFPSINRGIEVFMENNTDPWYAQAILMIESPGKIAYSNAGALGPFQLMKSVARHHGLKVNSEVDERKDFDKSAKAASHLIRTGCVPEAKRILRKFGINIEGEDVYSLGFRLTVLHVYHAGAGNVEGVLTNVVKPSMGGIPLITKVWQSQYKSFGNSSQNYSQLALAALLVLDDLIYTKCTNIYECGPVEP